jgi:hypothetical protein
VCSSDLDAGGEKLVANGQTLLSVVVV